MRASISTLLASLLFVLAAGRTVESATPERALSPSTFSASELRRILRMSPLPPVPEDPSNAVADDPRATAFGERLFFDPQLSGGGDVSCANCHDPQRDWTEDRPTSDQDARFPKNAPSLWNTAYNRWFYWDGRADSAWSQVLGPLEGESEMASDRLQILHTVRRDSELREAYTEVFGALPDGVDDPERFPPNARPIPRALDHPLQLAWASMTEGDRHAANTVFTNLAKAIAAFERTLLLGDTPFDRFVARLRADDLAARDEISEAALRGLKIFAGRGDCTLCHSGPTFSDGEFHDLGIALGANLRIDPGRHRGVLTILQSPFTRAGRYADALTPAAPIFFLEQRGHQLGEFKTPMLRNVARTPPYLHDGRFDTLFDVVRFYSTRTGARPLGHPTTLLQPLELTDSEIADVVAFLETLTALDPEIPSAGRLGCGLGEAQPREFPGN